MKALGDDEQTVLQMRFVGDEAAHGFHIELGEAVLEGGGVIAGRVHRDADLPDSPLLLTARCIETWRQAPPAAMVVATTRARPPRWHHSELWSTRLELTGLHDAHWVRFEIAIPPGLPVAVEARSIAWRYEIEVRRPRRLRLADRAVTTPLRYRALTIDRELPLPLRLA